MSELPSEIVAYIFQYLSGNEVLDTVHHVPELMHDLTVSYHNMDLQVPLKTHVPPSIEHHFTYMLSERDLRNYTSKYGDDTIELRNGVNYAIDCRRDRMYKPDIELDKFNNIMKYIKYIIPNLINNSDYPYPREKYCEYFTNDITDNSGSSLMLKGMGNIDIKGTTIKKLVLHNCHNITVHSKIKEYVFLQNCQNINIATPIVGLKMHWCKDCKFDTIGKLKTKSKFNNKDISIKAVKNLYHKNTIYTIEQIDNFYTKDPMSLISIINVNINTIIIDAISQIYIITNPHVQKIIIKSGMYKSLFNIRNCPKLETISIMGDNCKLNISGCPLYNV